MPTSGNMGNMGMPMGSMHSMTQEEWDSRMAFQGMMLSMGMQLAGAVVTRDISCVMIYRVPMQTQR